MILLMFIMNIFLIAQVENIFGKSMKDIIMLLEDLNCLH